MSEKNDSQRLCVQGITGVFLQTGFCDVGCCLSTQSPQERWCPHQRMLVEDVLQLSNHDLMALGINWGC